MTAGGDRPAGDPTVALSIVSHGQRDIALQLLRDIERLKPPAVRELVYTANIDEAPLPPLDLGPIRLVVRRNPAPKGFGANHNAAFADTGSDWFAVLNPDLRFPRDPLPALLAATAAAPGLGLVAPRIVDPEGRLQNTSRTLYTPREMLRQKRAPTNAGDRADWLAGMFLMTRRDAWLAIGGFDERYFLYIEDVDFCSRLVLAGWLLRQVDEATVIHDARRQSHRSLQHALWHLTGMLRYWGGWPFRNHRRLLQDARRRETKR